MSSKKVDAVTNVKTASYLGAMSMWVSTVNDAASSVVKKYLQELVTLRDLYGRSAFVPVCEAKRLFPLLLPGVVFCTRIKVSSSSQ